MKKRVSVAEGAVESAQPALAHCVSRLCRVLAKASESSESE